MQESKACSKCKQIKPLTDFYLQSSNASYRAACKKCCNKSVNDSRAKDPTKHQKQNLAYYYANKDKLNEYRRSKWPELYLSKIEYHKQKGKRYRTENPDKIAGIARRKRAKKKANGWEKYSEAQVLSLHGPVCHLCQKEIDLSLNRKIGAEGWRMSLQIDHVLPISKGGPDTLDNVKPAHAKCNMDKGDKVVRYRTKMPKNADTSPVTPAASPV